VVKFLKEYWFGICLGFFVFLFILFAVIVMIAPHNDAQMRGFTPCTYQMITDFNSKSKVKMSETFFIINRCYGCYLKVIGKGAVDFISGRQQMPWSNYLFKSESVDSENLEDEAQEIEAYPQDLLDANLLNDQDDTGQLWVIGEEEKENVDEKE